MSTVWTYVALGEKAREYRERGWEKAGVQAWIDAENIARSIGNFGHGLKIAGALAHVDQKCDCAVRRR